MTFEEAWKESKDNKVSVRHDDMGPGWKLIVTDKLSTTKPKKFEHWFVNPVTGALVQFAISDTDRNADWYVMS